MIKILAIGNSFSEDATTYLHDMAEQGGVETKVVNLYIGGCSLLTHNENIVSDAKIYRYDLNGQITERTVSIKEALTEDNWEIVTMQQASHDSGIEASYFPYIVNLSDYVKQYAPAAKQMIHQTWAYELDSTHQAFARYNNSQTQMYYALQAAYAKAAGQLDLDVIPCGEVIQQLRSLPEFDYAAGGQSLCRDGFHMHFIYGRYATAATWYARIFRKSIMNNSYLPPRINGEDYDEHLIHLIKQVVSAVR